MQVLSVGGQNQIVCVTAAADVWRKDTASRNTGQVIQVTQFHLSSTHTHAHTHTLRVEGCRGSSPSSLVATSWKLI